MHGGLRKFKVGTSSAVDLGQCSEMKQVNKYSWSSGAGACTEDQSP